MNDVLKVKKFADEHIDEFHWDKDDLVVFVRLTHIDNLCEFLGRQMLIDDKVECVLGCSYLIIPHFEHIVECYNLDEDDMNEIFPKED